MNINRRDENISQWEPVKSSNKPGNGKNGKPDIRKDFKEIYILVILSFKIQTGFGSFQDNVTGIMKKYSN